MFKSDERDLEGGCEEAQCGTEKRIREGSGDNTTKSKIQIKRCAVCRMKFKIPDAAHTAALRTLCIECRRAFGYLEPRYSYSVQVHIGDPTLYYVQRLKSLSYVCTDWRTVKRYMSLADAMQYIYDRTGER